MYIARKMSKIGRRFAFIKFLNSHDQNQLPVDLNRIWIGNFHLFATMARFDRRNKDNQQ